MAGFPMLSSNGANANGAARRIMSAPNLHTVPASTQKTETRSVIKARPYPLLKRKQHSPKSLQPMSEDDGT